MTSVTTQYRYVNLSSTSRQLIDRQWLRRRMLALGLLMGLVLAHSVGALQTCVEFLDNFASVSYSSNNGTANFAGAWTEIGESDGASSGNVAVISSGTLQGLRIHNANVGAQRTMNLSAYNTASLNLLYRRNGLTGSSKYVQVLISTNGTTFTEIGRFAGAATDSAYQVFSFNITPYISSTTSIRFFSTGLTAVEDVYIDSVSISACNRQLTTCGASFPDAASSNSSAGLVSFASSGQVLNSPDRILEAPTVTIGVPNTSTCGTNIQCVASATNVNTIDPGAFKTTTSTTNMTVASGATATLGPATTQWDQVILNSNSTLTVNTSTSTEFRIDELTLNSPSTLNLPAGDYWIRNLQIQNGAHINVSGSGTVRIFVNDAASINSSSYVNSPSTNSSGTVSQLVWYSYSDLSLSNGSTMSGLIYSRGNITLGSASYIFGAVTAANVALQVNSVISYSATAIDAVNFGGMCSNLYTATGWYSFDEASWTGAAGEVADGGSNNLDGRARSGTSSLPVTASTGSGCRYGVFNGPSSQQYVEVLDNALLNASTEVTVGVWVYARSLPSSDLMSIVSKDTNYEFHLNPSGTVFWWWNDSSGNTRSFSSNTALTLNAWHHVAITYKSGAQTIYIDGVANGSTSFTGTLRASGTPLQFAQDQGYAGRFFDGYLDEVRIYNTALSQAQVQEMMGLNHSCSTVVVNHFDIATDGSGITCETESVTITAHNASHVAVTGYTGTINISTNTGIGNWSLSSGSGTFSNGAVNDGAATYTFAATDSSVTLLLSHLATGLVNINVSNGAVSETTGGYASHDDTIDFVSAGLAILSRNQLTAAVTSTLPTQISGKTSAAGWNVSDIILRAVQTNQTTYECEAAVPAGARNVLLSYQCMTPTTCASNDALTMAGSTIGDNPASGVTDSRTVSLTFDAQATATIPLIFNDAGAIRLNAATAITDSAGSSLTLSGSNTVNVRPFGLGFTNIISGTTSNPAGTASTGSGFAVAGAAFSATVAGYRFAAGQDTDNDGVPDSGATITSNGTTPNFAFTGATVSMPTALLTPAVTGTSTGGIAGTLAGAPATFNFVSNSASLSNLTYSEVGSLRLRAQALDYLGVADADIQGDSPAIGRFYPQNFELVSSVVTPGCASSATPFTYMGQPFAVNYQLIARRTATATTRNYDTSAGYLGGSVAYVAENSNAGSSLAGRVTVAGGRWDNGVYVLNDGDSSFAVTNSVFVRNTAPPPVLDGPFDGLQLGIVLTDADSRAISSLDMNALSTGDCATTSSCTAKKIGSAMGVRYGRLALRDATGSDRATAIAIPALVEYYNGGQFVRNENDSCTLYGASQINDINYTSPLSGYTDQRDTSNSANTAGRWWLPTSDTAMAAGLFRDYPNGLKITPVPGVTGRMGISLNALPVSPAIIANPPTWLLYDWDGNSATADTFPSCTLTLGQARGNDRVILWRERHPYP